MKKYLLIIILFFLLMPIIAVWAKGYTMEVKIPNVPDQPELNQYLRGIFIFLVSACGIIAMLGIMIGGYQYMTAAGNASKIEDAKSRIKSAIMGLVLALCSYLILYMINPDLVALRMPSAEKIDDCRLKEKWEHIPGDESTAEKACLAKKDCPEGKTPRFQKTWDNCCFCETKEEGEKGTHMAMIGKGGECEFNEDCFYDLVCREKEDNSECQVGDECECVKADTTGKALYGKTGPGGPAQGGGCENPPGDKSQWDPKNLTHRRTNCFDSRLICQTVYQNKCWEPKIVESGETCGWDGECCQADDWSARWMRTCKGINGNLLCNQKTKKCQYPGAGWGGDPCKRNEECESNICEDFTCTFADQKILKAAEDACFIAGSKWIEKITEKEGNGKVVFGYSWNKKDDDCLNKCIEIKKEEKWGNVYNVLKANLPKEPTAIDYCCICSNTKLLEKEYPQY